MVMDDRPRWNLLFDWRLHLLAALGFAGLALLLHGCYSHDMTALNLEPATLPLPTEAASVGPARFQIGYSGVYEVVVTLSGFRDEQARRAAVCGLGIDPRTEARCGAISPIVNLTWRLQQLQPGGADSPSVIRSDSGVASGQAAGGGFSHDMIERRLTVFTGQRGAVYSLLIDSHADLGPLARFRPSVRVQPTMMENENIVLRYGFADLGAWLAGALGSATLVLACVSWYRHRGQRR